MISQEQKAFNAFARYVQKPMLAHIHNQRVLNGALTLMAFAIKPLSGTRQAHISLAGIPTRRMTPPQAAGNTLLYIHGGGFTIGASLNYRWLAARIADQIGATAYLPDYRLGDRHPYPAAPEDCLSAYRALLDQGDPATIVLVGDSAGGCLLLNTLTRARDAGLPLPAAIGLFSPVTDLSGSLPSVKTFRDTDMVLPATWIKRAVNLYLDGHDPRDPQVSPHFADLTGLPPALIQVAEGEILRDDAIALSEKLPKAQLDLWHGVPHGWQLAAGRSPEADEAVARMAAFLNAQLP
ncbi:alpha/beta hydrolase [Litoreibacter janthinus]|uniref:Acetyl esterase/lipase n=1 Tax=Litoreibacter janthinus TaxID=670154 RepID=A0A1I6GPL9_9RHOB|nr:alpha/beta hydrolase [Litoreibacter janthinus]SFR44066.1 Acetyl esterase/lipase [Litoreibacter janthinus]